MRKAIVQLAERRTGGQHPGLILQRYPAAAVPHNQKEKAALYRAAIGAAGDVARSGIYHAAFDRWKTSVPAIHAAAELATVGRLIVGLGAQNVLETGLTLHHTYGVPIVSGSALKGLAAHYCDQIWGQKHEEAAPIEYKRFRKEWKEKDHEYHKLLFGTTEDGGVITFHDAWIMPDSLPTALQKDVMTPHHPDYQRDPDKDDKFRPPTDFDSPNPVSFLSVAGTFLVAVSWHSPEHADSEKWTKLAFRLLSQALDEWGIGGKTSSGYGRLVAEEAINMTTKSVTTSSGLSATAATQPSKPKELPKTWDSVEAKIVPDAKGRGRLFACHEESGLVGPILKPEEVPEPEREPDTPLRLIVAMIGADGKQIQFLYPTPANLQRAQQSQSKPQGRHGGARPSGRR